MSEENNEIKNEEGQNAGQEVKLVTIADLNIRGVKYKIATKAFEGRQTERNLQAIILRYDQDSNKFRLVSNNDEAIAVWEQFKKLHAKGVEEGKIQVKAPTDHATPNITVKQGKTRLVSEEELHEIDAIRAKEKERQNNAD